MPTAEMLMSKFTENYIGKIFYFCLRKTGSPFSAEDLAQDISLSVFTELRRGVIPDNFSAWVWQIARNRYAHFADARHRKNEAESAQDISEYEIADDFILENEFVKKEDISLLRRELAFISSEYRTVLAAYYHGAKSVKEIAASLKIPEGTVKSKLFRARNILKEGMNMAREFGILSYKPENVAFVMNGSNGDCGEPWSIISHSIYKNILLAAYRMPSSAEELSVELGISLPYMEEELEFLVDATLMKKNGDKYETNIFIVSTGTQDKINAHLYEISPSLTETVIKAIEYRTRTLDKKGVKWHGGYQCYEDMKWVLIMRLVDSIEHKIRTVPCEKLIDRAKIGPWGHTLRPNGGEWDIIGFEMAGLNVPKPDWVGLHGCDDYGEKESIDFGQYKFNYKRICDQTPTLIGYNVGKALLTIASESSENIADVYEKEISALLDYGYIKKSENGYIPTFAVFYSNDLTKGLDEDEKQEYLSLVKAAEEIVRGHYNYCRELIYSEVPEFMKEDSYQIMHACANVFTTRGAVTLDALKCGYTTYSDKKDEGKERMLGAYITV